VKNRQLLNVEIGGICLSVACNDPAVFKNLENFYAAFTTGNTLEYHIQMNVDNEFKAADYSDDVELSLKDNIYALNSSDFTSPVSVIS